MYESTRQAIVKLSWIALVGAQLIACTSTVLPVVAPNLLHEETVRQNLDAVRMELVNTERIHRLAWPIVAKNVDICEGYTERTIGLFMVRKQDYAAKLHDAAEQIHHFDNHVVVAFVVPGTPIAKANLHAGDRIVGLGDFTWTPETKVFFNDKVLNVLRNLEAESTVIHLSIERDSEQIDVAIEPVTTCKFDLRLSGSSRINASANGINITVNEGLIRFFDDAEIQLVIAHELAHNLKRMHVYQALAKRGLGLVAEFALSHIGVPSFGWLQRISESLGQKGFEREADYISVYFLANAGLDTAEIGSTWRKLGTRGIEATQGNNSHPSYPQRYVNLLATHAEIEEKRKNNEPLRPNSKRTVHR